MNAIQHNIVQSSPVLSSSNVGVVNTRPASQPASQTVTQQIQVSPTATVKQDMINNTNNEKQATRQNVQQAIQQATQVLSQSSESIAFGYEEKLGQLFVTVIDKDSGEVIREIPSKEFIQHQVFMKEMVGLLLDKQV